MRITTKSPSKWDYEQVLKLASTDALGTLGVSGFLQGKVGHRIQKTVINSTTDDYSYYNGAILLMTLRIIYDDSTKAAITSAERTA